MTIARDDLVDWAPSERRTTDPTPFLVLGSAGHNDLLVKTLAGLTKRVSRLAVTKLVESEHTAKIRETFARYT